MGHKIPVELMMDVKRGGGHKIPVELMMEVNFGGEVSKDTCRIDDGGKGVTRYL